MSHLIAALLMTLASSQTAKAEAARVTVYHPGFFTHDVEARTEEWVFKYVVKTRPEYEADPSIPTSTATMRSTKYSYPDFGDRFSYQIGTPGSGNVFPIIYDRVFLAPFPNLIYEQWAFENDRGAPDPFECCSPRRNDDDHGEAAIELPIGDSRVLSQAQVLAYPIQASALVNRVQIPGTFASGVKHGVYLLVQVLRVPDPAAP